MTKWPVAAAQPFALWGNLISNSRKAKVRGPLISEAHNPGALREAPIMNQAQVERTIIA
jgi:hypothetical protein